MNTYASLKNIYISTHESRGPDLAASTSGDFLVQLLMQSGILTSQPTLGAGSDTGIILKHHQQLGWALPAPFPVLSSQSGYFCSQNSVSQSLEFIHMLTSILHRTAGSYRYAMDCRLLKMAIKLRLFSKLPVATGSEWTKAYAPASGSPESGTDPR